jgi:general secretion pathway protein C
MVNHNHVMNKYVLRIVTLMLAALAALSATFWVLKIMQGTSVDSVTASSAPLPPASPSDPKALARVLGGDISAATQAASAPTAINLILQGVIAHGTQRGAALIAVNGKPAKPFPVGAAVDGDWVLQSLSTRSATLKNAAGTAGERVLELPPLKP